MEPTKYRFKIWYQTPQLIKVNNFMRRMDVWKEGEGNAIEDVITFQYSKGHQPISYFKDLLRQSFEKMGYKLIHIEGGPIE